MHSPCGAAKKAQTVLQSIYDRYLRHICGVRYITPSAMLLEELELLPLQLFRNKVAASPVGLLFHTILPDNLDDAFSVGAKKFYGSIATYLQSIGQPMPHDRGIIPVLEVGAIVKALRQHLGGTHDYALHCRRAVPNTGVVACTCHHWFEPFSLRRQYCQLPVSGRRTQQFLRFRLGSHQLPVVLGRFAGDQHVARASRVCTHCCGVAVADELHMIFECLALHRLRQQYAPLFSMNIDTMRSFFAKQDHMQVFRFVLSCLDFFPGFGLCLLLYVIRLVGWLLSLSIQPSSRNHGLQMVM